MVDNTCACVHMHGVWKRVLVRDGGEGDKYRESYVERRDIHGTGDQYWYKLNTAYVGR